MDHWTSYRRGYIGFTVHWYDDKLIRKHACLGRRRIMGKYMFNVLAKVIESVIAEFKLSGKVTHCITDSGPNFVKVSDDISSIIDKEISVCSIMTTLKQNQMKLRPLMLYLFLTS